MQYATNAIINALVSHSNRRFVEALFTSKEAVDRELEQQIAINRLWKQALSDARQGKAALA